MYAHMCPFVRVSGVFTKIQSNDNRMKYVKTGNVKASRFFYNIKVFYYRKSIQEYFAQERRNIYVVHFEIGMASNRNLVSQTKLSFSKF